MKKFIIIGIVFLVLAFVTYVVINKLKKKRDQKLSEIDENLAKTLSENNIASSPEYQVQSALISTNQDVYLGNISDPYSDIITLQ